MDQTYQIGNYPTTWCAHSKEVLDDLGCQSELILANLKLLQDEQQIDKQKREAKEQRKREKKRRESQAPRFSKTMDVPQNWDNSESQEESDVESTSQVGYKLETTKPAKVQKNKSEIATLENAATMFPSFILPSLQKANVFREANKYPRIEEDLFPANSSGYVLDLDQSKNPAESIRI